MITERGEPETPWPIFKRLPTVSPKTSRLLYKQYNSPDRMAKARRAPVSKTRGSPAPPGPTSRLPLPAAGKTRKTVALLREHCACPVARLGAGRPRGGFPRLPELDARDRVRADSGNSWLPPWGTSLPGTPAWCPGGREAAQDCASRGVYFSSGGWGARGVAATRDCPPRSGQPSSAWPSGGGQPVSPREPAGREPSALLPATPSAGLLPHSASALAPTGGAAGVAALALG